MPQPADGCDAAGNSFCSGYLAGKREDEYVSAERNSDGAGSQCPVCRWPDQGFAVCNRCGMQLRARFALDPAPAAGERGLADQIAAARLRYDLRAAVMAASWTGERDYALLARLGRLARGGPPTAHEIEQAEVEFDAGTRRAPTAGGLGFTLSRLVAGEIEAIEFVEIGPDSMSAQTLVTNELCVPVRSSSGESHPWPSMVPALPADDDLLRFRLAGGIGDDPRALVDPPALAKAAEAAVRQAVRQRLKAATAAIRDGAAADEVGEMPGWIRARVDTVLVRRTFGWPLLEAAAAVARTVMHPVAEIVSIGTGTLADIVDATGRRAPLRYGYDLVLAEINPGTGEVRPDRWPLFAPGTVIRRHDRPTRNAYVKAPPSAADQLALPVVMRRGTDAAAWPAVGIAAMPGSAPGTTQLQVRLVAPGQVSFHGQPDVVSGDGLAFSWPELLTGLPDSVPAHTAVDLVMLVELGGSAGAVAGRVALAADVAGKLHHVNARIALAGYRDHFHSFFTNAARTRDRLVVGCGLEPVSGVNSVLARRDFWRAVDVRDDYAAPLEDALYWVQQEGLTWRPDARHLLVVFGSRPPHPGNVHDHATPKATVCPYHRAWRDILGRLRGDHIVTCVAVRHEGAAQQADDDAEQAWQEFCAEGFFSAVETSSADELLAAIGLAAGDNGARLPLAVPAGRSSGQPGRAGGA
jgi:hypothetical protein